MVVLKFYGDLPSKADDRLIIAQQDSKPIRSRIMWFLQFKLTSKEEIRINTNACISKILTERQIKKHKDYLATCLFLKLC